MHMICMYIVVYTWLCAYVHAPVTFNCWSCFSTFSRFFLVKFLVCPFQLVAVFVCVWSILLIIVYFAPQRSLSSLLLLISLQLKPKHYSTNSSDNSFIFCCFCCPSKPCNLILVTLFHNKIKKTHVLLTVILRPIASLDWLRCVNDRVHDRVDDWLTGWAITN